MTASLLIRGGRVIDPAGGRDGPADVLIVDGRIAEVGAVRDGPAEVIDASGCVVCPGLIDMHVHLREPGNEEKETIATGTAAAVAGGFTTVCCMPNTNPPLDQESAIEFIYRQAARSAKCRVYPIGALTKGRAGKELAEIGTMIRAGAVAFSDDGCGVANSAVMFRALQYVSMFDKPVIQHCEDPELAAGGCMNAGVTATRLGLTGIPSIAEEVMLQRDLLLTAQTSARYHAAHVSTAGSVTLIREAKRRGVRVTAEVTPHHLLLTEACCAEFDTHAKVNPPLRTEADVDACRRAVADGTIDCLVTDHAPHASDEKSLEFQDAPFGIIGLETAVPLTLEVLVESGLLDWPRWVACWTANPARVLGLPRGTLSPGAEADVTVIDPAAEWTYDVEKSCSRSRNSPFHGRTLRGRAVATIVGGQVGFRLA